jgi:hypothetical protein
VTPTPHPFDPIEALAGPAAADADPEEPTPYGPVDPAYIAYHRACIEADQRTIARLLAPHTENVNRAARRLADLHLANQPIEQALADLAAARAAETEHEKGNRP